MEDLPRHLGTHVGGMVLTGQPLVDLMPIERARKDGRTVVIWDKDDLASLGVIKVDLLGLGMLALLGTCLRLIGVASLIVNHVTPLPWPSTG